MMQLSPSPFVVPFDALSLACPSCVRTMPLIRSTVVDPFGRHHPLGAKADLACCTPLPIVISTAPSLARIEFGAVAGHTKTSFSVLHSPVGGDGWRKWPEIRISANYKEERLTGMRV